MALQKQEPTGRQLAKGRWTPREDEKLKDAVALHGATNWASLSSKAGLNRCGKSCRLRWVNYLSPDLKRGDLSEQEEDLIIRLHKLLGNRWALIARRLPGRTDNEIKNYWNTHLSKRVNKKEKKRNKKEKKTSDGAKSVADEKPSVADDNQKVHVEMKQECLSSEVVTSAAIIKKEVMINPDDYNTNIFDGAKSVADEKPSVADDDQKVHVEMKQECLSSEVVTSAAIIKKEVMINPDDYNTNIFDVDDFFNLLNEEPSSWEVQVLEIP